MKQPKRIKRLLAFKHVPIPASLCDSITEKVTVVIDRRNKAGELVYPYIYQMEAREVMQYGLISRPGGYPGYAVPLGHFKKIAKRKELCLQGDDTISADDPAVKDWRGYL